MLTQIRTGWRLVMLRGLAALAFGVLKLIWPGLTLFVPVVMFGAFALVDGKFTLVDVAQNAPGMRAHRGWYIFDGVASVLAGIVTHSSGPARRSRCSS